MNNKNFAGDTNQSKLKFDISFIIINYNLANEIDHCLSSLIETTSPNNQINYEVIVVDNNSPEKNLPGIEEKYKCYNIRFYYLNENLGFGKGCNFGFSKASGDYICFLNPDTVIKENIFLSVINLFKSDGSIGIIGPRQETRGPFFDFSAGFSPNIFFELFNLLGLGVFLEGFIISLYGRLKKDAKINVNWILGAAVFIKASLFDKIGGFDSDYFMFFEELDLCKRVAGQGLKILYCPEFRIHHIGSVSGKKDYTSFTIRTYASKKIFFNKHFKSFYGFIMKSLLRLQIFSQILIWSILYMRNKEKSRQKLKAFFYLLNHNFIYEYKDIHR